MKRIFIHQNIYKCIFLITIVLILSETKHAYAASSSRILSTMRISPVLIKIQLRPGAKYIYPIRVDNLGDAPLPLSANVESFNPNDESTGFSLTASAHVSKLAEWIVIPEPNAIIPARSSQEFSIIITIPSQVPIGGYYAMIYFTPLYPDGSVGSKVGVVTLANIGILDTTEQNAIIQKFSSSRLIYEDQTITTSLAITNDSLYYFSVQPQLSVRPLWGNADNVYLDEKTILPGKTRSWKSVFTIQNSKWGIFLATISLPNSSGSTRTKTIPIILLPIRMILTCVILILLIIISITKRKNIKNAFLVLLGKPISPSTSSEQKTNARSLIGENAQHQPSRIDPTLILNTLHAYNGSVDLTSKKLHIHRSTIHRWKKRATYLPHEGLPLQRKSTRPHHVRQSSVSNSQIQSILSLSTTHSAREIQKMLSLEVSTRTISRIIKSHHATP